MGAENHIYCLNSSNGEKIWSYYVFGSVYCSPVVAGGYVYIGFSNSDDNFYCFDALTGSKVWSFKTSVDVRFSSPAVADGYVYILSFDGNFYCLNA